MSKMTVTAAKFEIFYNFRQNPVLMGWKQIW
jgi:hypothetical protein